MQMQASPVLSLSPSSLSFNTCSSGRLAEIAARVVEEFRQESGSEDDIYETWPQQKQHQQLQQEVIQEEDDDFEFAFVCREPETSPISADEIFYNGQIRPIYPLFNTKLLNDDQTPDGENVDSTSFESKPRSHRLPLRKLMSEERETTSCSSSEAYELDGVTPGTNCAWTPKGGTSGSNIDQESPGRCKKSNSTGSSTTTCSFSEADELDEVTPGTYCAWTPKGGTSGSNIDQESPGRCKKSNSTGSSKRWKLRDLLYRSNRDGKDTFIFLAPGKRDKTSNADVNKSMEIPGKF